MENQKMYRVLIGLLVFSVLIWTPALLMAYTGEGQATLTLKSGSDGPAKDIVNITAVRFADKIKQRTNGKIQIAHYSDGQLGRWQQVLESVQAGNTAIFYHPPVFRSQQITQLPYLFRNLDHAVNVLNGNIGDELSKREIEKTGVYIFGSVYMGFRQCTFTKVAVRTPADMKGMKFRPPPMPLMMDIFKAMGARPTPVNFGELYLALRQGVVEGTEGPLDVLTTTNMWEVQKYLVLTGHSFTANFAHMNGKLWQSLTPETQKVWIDTWKEVSEEARKEVVDKEREYLSFWKSKGVNVIEPDLKPFKDSTKDVWKGFLTEPGEKEIYEKIQAVR
jgi:TRAP-type transport system periplasmic protein